MAASSELRDAFTPALLKSVRTLWFGDAADDARLVLPPMDVAKRWFSSDAEFDKVCVASFGEQLKIVQSTGATADDILTAVSPSSPLDWLSLVLLLDQIPRNCYRGPDSKLVFNVFDPVVLDLTLQAIKSGIPETPEIRHHLGYRFWFYLPLQHAEDRKIQELSLSENQKIFDDLKSLTNAPGPEVAGDASLQKTRAVLLEHEEVVERWAGMLIDFVKKHKAIIDEFGRYPHRNKPLGRESTEAEIRYLTEGGETFGSSR